MLLQHEELHTNVEDFASNPLAIYKSIKHLTYDLGNVRKNMMRNSYDGKLSILLKINLQNRIV